MEEDFELEVHPKEWKSRTLIASSWMHKYITGHGGKSIEQLTNYWANVKIHCHRDDKITISGPPERVEQVCKQIQASYIDIYKLVELTVDSDKLGIINEKTFVNHLQRETGTLIRFKSDCIVCIEGTKEAVLRAKSIIEEKSQETITIDCTPWAVQRCQENNVQYQEEYPQVKMNFTENQITLVGRKNHICAVFETIQKQYVDTCIELLVRGNITPAEEVNRYNNGKKAYIQSGKGNTFIWGTAAEVAHALTNFQIEHYPSVCIIHVPSWVHKHLKKELEVLYPNVICHKDNDDKITISGPFTPVMDLHSKILSCIENSIDFIELKAELHLLEDVFGVDGTNIKDIQDETDTSISLLANDIIRIEGAYKCIHAAKNTINFKLATAKQKWIELLRQDGYFHPEYVKVTIDCTPWMFKTLQAKHAEYKQQYANISIFFVQKYLQLELVLIGSRRDDNDVNDLHQIILNQYMDSKQEKIPRDDISHIDIELFNQNNIAHLEVSDEYITITGTAFDIDVAKKQLIKQKQNVTSQINNNFLDPDHPEYAMVTIECTQLTREEFKDIAAHFKEYQKFINLDYPEENRIIIKGRKDYVYLLHEYVLAKYVRMEENSIDCFMHDFKLQLKEAAVQDLLKALSVVVTSSSWMQHANSTPAFACASMGKDFLEFIIERKHMNAVCGKANSTIIGIQSKTETYIKTFRNGLIHIEGDKLGILTAAKKVLRELQFIIDRINRIRETTASNHPDNVTVKLNCSQWTVNKCIFLRPEYKKRYPTLMITFSPQQGIIKLNGRKDDVNVVHEEILRNYVHTCEVKCIQGSGVVLGKKTVNQYNSKRFAFVKRHDDGDIVIWGNASDIEHAMERLKLKE